MTRDLSQKTFVVTGANVGLGRNTALTLAAHNATVVLACRNLEAAKKTADAIR